MKLVCLEKIPHGLHYLKVGEEFDEPNEVVANMLIYLQRAEKAKPKVAVPVVVATAPIEPQVPLAMYETKVAEAQSPVASGDVEPMRTKRTYTRRDLTAEK